MTSPQPRSPAPTFTCHTVLSVLVMAHCSNGIIHGIHGSTMSAQGDISINNIINRNLNSESGTRGIDLLLEASAPSAFHNSGERFDPPKCHPRTRTHILTKIMNWVVGEVGWDEFIMWLYGPAGAGKSAIAQTMAELCYARHLLLGSFFFSRTDSKRNNEKCLIASIAYQIASNIPKARDAIEAAIQRDPAIFQSSVQEQLTTLIIDPLTQLSKPGFFHRTLQYWFNFGSIPVPYLIIIDGLDECLDQQIQQHILHAVSSALHQSSVPLKFLICSRAEHHLTREFTSLISGRMATHLPLEDGYQQNADIELYLIDSFHRISTTHHLKAYIPTTWPTYAVISTLVQKSSGQFIYAATVIKYISSDRHQPTRRLETILGMQPPRNDRPFAELDALYMGILSSVDDIKATMRLLGVFILANFSYNSKTPQSMGEFMFLDSGEVQCLLSDLASVIECVDKDTPIRMLHASFPDFLLDRSRSEEYYIDSFLMHMEIAQLCLSHIRVPSNGWEGSLLRCQSTSYAYCSIVEHLTQAEPSADLREALLNTEYITSLTELENTPPYSRGICDLLVEFLSFLKGSKFTDTEGLYLHHRNIYDGIIHKRIADFPLDAAFVFYLVLIEMLPHKPHLNVMDHNLWYTTESMGPDPSKFDNSHGRILHIHSTLWFNPSHFSMSLDYRLLLGESLSHPVHAGKYVLDAQKYAFVARFLLDYCIKPSPDSEEYFFRQVVLFPAINGILK